jgi:hypothetical protein
VAHLIGQPDVPDEEFAGPFSAWVDLKAHYGAQCDGVTDDTAAFQLALDELGTPGHSPVLYVPGGRCRITRTLSLNNKQYLSILGADPSATSVVWDGPAGGFMIAIDGVAYSRFGRLTWDGSGKAEAAYLLAWDARSDFFPTGNEHSDEVFTGLQFGIRAGGYGGEAETVVLRCKFIGNTRAGISLENFNTLNWWIRDSLFQSNNQGVSNQFYGAAGNFYVSDSVFIDSAEADLAFTNTGYFAARRNFSSGSKSFISSGPIGSAAAPFTIQGNTILDTFWPAISFNNPGPAVLIDNTVRSSAPQVVVREPYLIDPNSGDAVGIGNVFSSGAPYQVAGRLRSVDDRSAAEIQTPAGPSLPGVPPNRQRQEFEVRDGDIQSAIDAAVASNSVRAIVHVPYGSYQVARTLTIPAGSDVQLVGDGLGATQLVSAGAHPVLRLNGPSRAVVRDLSVQGNDGADGVWIDRADQQDGLIHAEQLMIQHAQLGLDARDMDQTRVNLYAFGMAYNRGVGLRAEGGSRVNIFGGASANIPTLFDVRDNSQVVAQDLWYEGPSTQYLAAGGSGTLVLSGVNLAGKSPSSLDASAFDGTVTVAVGLMASQDDGATNQLRGGASLLALGMVGVTDVPGADPTKTAVWAARSRLGNGGSVPVAEIDTGLADPASFLRNQLAPLRAVRPRMPARLPANTTDLRIYRLAVNQAATAIVLTASP